MSPRTDGSRSPQLVPSGAVYLHTECFQPRYWLILLILLRPTLSGLHAAESALYSRVLVPSQRECLQLHDTSTDSNPLGRLVSPLQTLN